MPTTTDIPLIEKLAVADTSLAFQSMSLVAGIIALAISCILRKNLSGTLTLDKCDKFSLLKTRTAAGIIAFAALIYFFLLSIQTLNKAIEPCDALSAKVNLMASFLVLVASALRLYDFTAIIPQTLDEPEILEIEDLPLI
ncbi:MAG: hypothetical protein ACK5L0_08975 [Candidatus Fimivivens sp.]